MSGIGLSFLLFGIEPEHFWFFILPQIRIIADKPQPAHIPSTRINNESVLLEIVLGQSIKGLCMFLALNANDDTQPLPPATDKDGVGVRVMLQQILDPVYLHHCIQVNGNQLGVLLQVAVGLAAFKQTGDSHRG